jgi:ubiquinone/menaquinone biosynthesis C-methylase UbiE
VELARKVGDAGHVWATEVADDELAEIRRRAEGAGLANVTTVRGDQEHTGLPAGCCDAILLRMVYHHFEDPAAMRADLLRALRPGGRLVVVDIEPQSGWRKLPGVPERGGHGIPAEELVRELTAAGFEKVEVHERWNDDPDRYCAVFRAPPAPPAEDPG